MTLDPRVRKDTHSFCHARLDRASSIFAVAFRPFPFCHSRQKTGPPINNVEDESRVLSFYAIHKKQ